MPNEDFFLFSGFSSCTKISQDFVLGLKPRPSGRNFWHPKNPPTKESAQSNSFL
jgi:hypothetical protein